MKDKDKIIRTVLSVAVVVACVLAVRWTIRTAMTRAYRAERDVGEAEMPVVPAHRDYSLAAATAPWTWGSSSRPSPLASGLGRGLSPPGHRP